MKQTLSPDRKVSGFDKPTKNPVSVEELRKWQESNKEWWEKSPMRYDWKKSVAGAEFSVEFYREIDARHFANAEEYLPSKKLPFDSLIDFPSLASMDTLEIGIGNGSHAELLSNHAKSFAGIDLTDYAIKSVSERFKLFNLRGSIGQMDAEHLDFPDASFDFVWSWGVIHHSSDTEKVLKEIYRVLRPGGRFTAMVYYRGWWDYYISGFIQGIFRGTLFKTRSIHKSVQYHTDGAIARYYTIPEWRKLVSGLFAVEDVFITGPKTDVVILPPGGAKSFIMRLVPAKLSLLMTRRFRMGSFLVSKLKKSAVSQKLN